MRQHKYRGLTFARKEIKNSLILSEDGSRAFIGHIELLDDGRVTVVHYEEVDPAMVGEFTGKRDSKRTKEFPEGQEIYEGDRTNKGTIRWSEEDCAWKAGDNIYSLLCEILDDIEVIGNIHDAPEVQS